MSWNMKIPKPEKPKKTRDKKKRLENKGLKLWKQLVINSFPICEGCNNEPTETAHHFWYRSNYGHLILDLDNGIGIGRSCHFTLHHKDPKEIEEHIRAKRGEEWYQRLKTKAYNRPNPGYKTLKWLNEQINKLQ